MQGGGGQPRRSPPRGPLRYIDLFAGLGGFHRALSDLGHECVFASEINPTLQKVYLRNFPEMAGKLAGDIRQVASFPEHDLVCAGFPCQPFSKSGRQRGTQDETRGTLFNDILRAIDERHPYYVLLENVGNFERHDGGNTWRVVREQLERRGYAVKGTLHTSTPGGTGLVSPHHLGYPQHRERFFVVASLGDLPDQPFPSVDRMRKTSFHGILQAEGDIANDHAEEAALSPKQVACIEHWNRLLQALPEDAEVFSPLWGDEFAAKYPFELRKELPANVPSWILWGYLDRRRARRHMRKRALLELLPAYARARSFPGWKKQFIRDSRQWWLDNRRHAPKGWLTQLRKFPFSLRKLEWHGGSERDLWQCVLQFRPSGLRAKKDGCIPALVAMTDTQIPIIGPRRRFLTRIEGLRLQGFKDTHALPASYSDAFAALGNAVHVKVVQAIAERLVGTAPPPIAPAILVRVPA